MVAPLLDDHASARRLHPVNVSAAAAAGPPWKSARRPRPRLVPRRPRPLRPPPTGSSSPPATGRRPPPAMRPRVPAPCSNTPPPRPRPLRRPSSPTRPASRSPPAATR